MSYEFEQGPVFPYPLRPSEYAGKEGTFVPEKKLELSEEEKKSLMDFESELFDELKEIKKKGKETHEVYVGALLEGKGKRMVEVIYKNGIELKEWTKKEAERLGLDMGDKDIAGDVYKAVFEDIFSENLLENDEGTIFSKFTEVIKENTGKEETIQRVIANNEKTLSEEELINIFSGLELKKIPIKWRKGIHDYTNKWAREVTKNQFWDCKGDVNKVENLKMICRLEDPDSNKSRLEEFKEFKLKIKKEQLKLGESEDKIDKAKVIVLDIYRKYINLLIADDLLLWNMAGEDGKEILKPSERRSEGIDKFIYGVGETFDKTGNRDVLTDWMRKTVDEIDKNFEETKDEIRINSDEAIDVANWIVKQYGFEDKWKVVRRKSGIQSLGIDSKTRKIYIPGEMNRGLMDFLSTISHEIEGHVLSHENSDALDIKLKIMEKYSAGGRDSILEEAGAKNVEDITWKWITGKENAPVTLYFRGLELKKKGGTFRDCLNLVAEIRAKELGFKSDQLFTDKDVFNQVFDKTYDRTLRLFREHTPLDDKSGRITSSDQLKYLEQKKVTEYLKKDGAEDVLYVNGFDLYSVKQLLELGVMDKTKVKLPKMVVMNKLWPALENGLKEGKTITEIVESLE